MKIALIFLIIILAFFLVSWFSTYQPQPIEAVSVVCTAAAPKLEPGQMLKILSWNVQFMAGKNYTFFFDLIDHSGPDIFPTATDVNQTLAAVAKIIEEEQPDIILLQELDDGAKRTGHKNQLSKLMELIPGQYTCRAEA
ncbi:endonuclease/exonuclease/phosphatase family protein, partial [bacterium]|nr:endonuclease/exonuclease/phosphatase family protein [bacterium]